jgi:beta-glucanase (GH16 family)
MKNKYFIPILFVLFSQSASVWADAVNEPPPHISSDYVLTWNDEFDGAQLNTNNWTAHIDLRSSSNGKVVYYTNKELNVYLKDGLLFLDTQLGNNHVDTQYHGDEKYTGAELWSNGKVEFQYGYIEMRGKIPINRGAWPAFWLRGIGNVTLPTWEDFPEIDIFESYSDDPHLYFSLHKWLHSEHVEWTLPWYIEPAGFADSFHTLGLERTPAEINYFVDGVKVGTQNIEGENMALMHQTAYILLTNTFYLNNTQNPNMNVDQYQTVFPGHFEIDYVRLYQKPEQETQTQMYNILKDGEIVGFMDGAHVDSIRADGYTVTTFLTGITPVNLGNVALGKTCTASVGDPSHLTDGSFERIAANRWMTGDSSNKPWLEIDLAGEYSISRIQTYAINTSSSPEMDDTYPVSAMTFQVWKDGDWETVFTETGITKAAFTKNFELVTTSKVRFFNINSNANATRWIEVEVYGYSSTHPLPESSTKVFLKEEKPIGQIIDATITVQTTGNHAVITHPNVEKLTFAEPSKINVALGKPVTASDVYSTAAEHQPANAVDGNYYTSAPRWLSNGSVNGMDEHWLEIDLQGEYSISSFKTWNGNAGYEYPVTRLKLQAWIDGDWVDVADSGAGKNNTDPCYGADFEPVATNKVRLYAYSRVRLFEIAVYGIMMY